MACIDDTARLDPAHDCELCPRLEQFRREWRARQPEWFNGPVPTFVSDGEARLLVVGLAPGLRGANRTGRPFTGDYAGDLLYATLADFGLSLGSFQARPDDGLKLTGAAITNAVRCVPPENKPTPEEITTCRPFLLRTIGAMPRLVAILALGKIAHDSVVRAFGFPASRLKFVHGARHALAAGLTLYDSYHCSRYNTNTGVLTEDMFRAVFEAMQQDGVFG
ncbi:MAG: uracil-DNA glycosylase [Ancalomicrobiaceae bacterium]|nr:uracil-DNA glycosylase [Ancalomicrobiaceae bacterium]